MNGEELQCWHLLSPLMPLVILQKDCIISSLQMRKPRHREGKFCHPFHTLCKWLIRLSKLDLCDSRSHW